MCYLSQNWALNFDKEVPMIHERMNIIVKSESQSPKVKTKRTWADSKITWMAQNDHLDSSGKKIDQVDSENKDMG